MKKFAAVLILISLSTICIGKSIPKEQLIDFGKMAYRQKMHALNVQNNSDDMFKFVDFIAEGGDTLMAILNFSDSGFIILSADDAVYPVLAYSNESNFFLTEVSPASLYWLELYKA
ncbi:MAG: Spi family protease inhibitor, partial [Bacteroidales bacterium]|nr:Spi family protease inhibitor [Bacteroidales bacterium]